MSKEGESRVLDATSERRNGGLCRVVVAKEEEEEVK